MPIIGKKQGMTDLALVKFEGGSPLVPLTELAGNSNFKLKHAK